VHIYIYAHALSCQRFYLRMLSFLRIYLAFVVDELIMTMEHWWYETDRVRLKYLEKDHRKFVHHKPEIDWPAIG